MFKRQQLNNNKSDETEPKILKSQCVNIYDNKEGERLDIYKDESDRYNLLPSLA